MRQDRFRHLLDAYGADVMRWPAGEREDAQRHLASQPSARADLAQAERLDATLDRSSAWLSDAQLESLVARATERVAQMPAPARTVSARPRPMMPRLRWFGAPVVIPALAACCFAVGIVVGLQLGPASYVDIHDQFASHALLANPAP